MKVTFDIDCTPLEARSFLGLPDLSPIHEHYVQTVMGAMENAGSVEQMQALLRTFSPMGEAGMSFFKQMMDISAGAMSGSTKS
jgi:Family of unknown function (DUF6489)